MNLKNINDLNLQDLKDLLKQVKNYKDLKTKLGKRGIDLFNREQNNKDFLFVEYFGEITNDKVFDYSKRIYKDVFSCDIKQTDINFVRNDSIKGGIKVYKNDEMVDLSFLKIEKQIK